MKEVLHYILSRIVADPSQIEIIEDVNEEGENVLNVKIPEEERGIVIGKGGKNIQSIRNIVSIIGKRENKKIRIKILD
jgi:predicted RNA-binding protein YlqC (UPF0109 family)